MIQATAPMALGLFFKPWLLDKSFILAAAVTLAAVGTMFVAFRRGRISWRLPSVMGLLYLVSAGLLLALHLT